MRISTKLPRQFALVAGAISAALSIAWTSALAQQRVTGIDVSDYQGNITWSSVVASGRSFVVARSSRGGTSGFYNENDSANNNRLNTWSQQYNDSKFYNNITQATAAGLLVGQYHFGRMDITSYERDGQVIAQSGTDEANHMLQRAGPYMRPGYLLPMFDFEAGSGIRSAEQLAQYSIAFSDRIFAATGIRPGVYIGGNYASPMNSVASASTMVADYPVLWTARWPNQADPNSIDIQHINPNDSSPTLYGPWDNFGNSQPWHFWQYASTGSVSGISGNVDLDVSHGTIEYVKDHLVPAMWTNDTSGAWGTISNWNSDNRDYSAVDTSKGPAPRLPGAVTSGVNDTVILDRPSAAITVTHGSGTTTNIRKLYVAETLNITGGSLTVNYDPTTTDAVGNSLALGSWAPGTWNSQVAAEFNGAVTLSGNASLSVQKAQVDVGRTFTLAGGTLSFNTINLMPSSGTPGKIAITGDIAISPLTNAQSNATATIANGSGSGTSGSIDLGNAVRTITVNDGSAATDLQVSVPMTGSGGGIIKAGAGAMSLTGANTFTGAVAVNQSSLSLSGNGTAAAASGFTVQGGASLLLDNSGTNNNNRIGTVPITLRGGTLGFVGNTTTETTGSFSAPEGASTVALSGSGTSTLAFGSFARAAGATVNFTGADSTHKATFTGGVVAGSFIDQGAFVGGNDFAVYDSSGFVRVMTTGAGASDYATSVTSGRHVKLTASASGVGSTSINTLNLAGATVGLGLSSGSTLTLTNGGVIKSGGGLGTISDNTGSLATATEYVFNTVSASDELAVGAAITGGTGLTKTGLGVLTFSNVGNNYAGPTTIAQGSLKLAAFNVIPDSSDVVVGSGASLNLNGFSDTVGNITMYDGSIGSSGTLTLNGTTAMVAYRGAATGGTIAATNLVLGTGSGVTVFDVADGAASADLTVNSVIQNGGSANGIRKKGTGTLQLTGANSFSGDVFINAGTLSVSSINATTSVNQPLGRSNGAISMGLESSATLGATLEYTGGNSATLSRDIYLEGVFGSSIRATAGTLTIGGNKIESAGTNTLVFDAAGANITVNSAILTNLTLTKVGTGTLTLSNINTYTGNTNVNEGVLAYSATNQLGSNSAIVMGGGTLRTLASLTEGRNISMNAGGGTIDTNGFNSTFNGAIVGNGNLTKIGAGTLTFSGIGNYGGSFSINGGALALTGTMQNTTEVDVNSGGTLSGTGAVNGNAQVLGTGIINLSGTGHIVGSLTAYGGNWNGAGSAGSVSVTGGTFSVGSGANLTTSAVQVNGGTLGGSGTITGNVTLADNPINYSAVGLSAGGNITGTLQALGGTTSWTGTGSVAGMTTVSAGTLYVSGTMQGAGGLTLASGANLHGTGTINKTLTLSGNNHLGGLVLSNTAGATTPTLGTLTIGAPVVWGASNLFISDGPVSTQGDTISGNLTIETPSDLQHGYDLNYVVSLAGSGTAAITTTGVLAGNGNVTKPVTITGNGIINLLSPPTVPASASTLTSTLTATGGNWNGVGSVSGLTNVTSGTFTIGSGANLTANGNLTVSGTGAIGGTGTITGNVTYTSSAANTFSGIIAGSGKSLTVNSTTGGVLTLLGNNTFTGALAVSAGTLNVSSINATAVANQPLGNSAAAITLGAASSNGTLQYSGGAAATLNRSLTIGGAGGGTIRNTGGLLTLGSTVAGNGNPVTFDAAFGNINANGAISGTGTTVTKNGAATLTLNASSNSFTGLVTINDGIVKVTGNNQLGTAGVITNMTVVTGGSGGSGHGGTLQLSGNVGYNFPLTIGGGGLSGVSVTPPGSTGALDNLSGDNTWSGPITLAGTGTSGTDPLENQISAQVGTLRLTGVVQNGAGGNSAWVKSGNGEVVLSGGSANTYSGLTRLFGGQLILEKDGALGSGGSLNSSTGNTFQIAGGTSTIAFRAPGASPGFNYNTYEVINTNGTGAPGFAQVDNLGGDNTFAGSIAFDGPALAGARQGTIGVRAGSLNVMGGLYARGNDGTPRNLIKTGIGKLILSGDGGVAGSDALVVPLANSTFIVSAGTVEMRGPSLTTANLPGVTAWGVASGTLLASSGRFSTDTVSVGAGSQFNLTGGSADIATIDLTAGGSFGFTGGTLHAQNIVCDDLINQGGTLAPGNSAGNTAIGGNYIQQSGATLAIEIGGTVPVTDFDTVSIDGSAALGGVLDVSLINGFTPAAGQQFTVVTAGSVTSDGLALGGSAASLFSLVVGASSVTLQAILQGDFNHDDMVDAADYVAWRMGLGTTYSPTDYDLWRAHFGETMGSGAGFAAKAGDASVPEPGTTVLVTAASLLWLLRRTRRWHG